MRVVTQRSNMPLTFPGRSADAKYSAVPLNDSDGRKSFDCSTSGGRGGLLTMGPRFTGTAQGSAVLARVATHKSDAPFVPGRSEPRNMSSPAHPTGGGG